jgi:hypothetical protein
MAIEVEERFSAKRIGLLVDSDLGNHDKYNARELPIAGDFFLPEKYQLIYATSDSGKDNLLNKFMGLCDRRGRDLLNKIEAENCDEGLIPVEGRAYSHFRQWDPSPDDQKNLLSSKKVD